MGTLLRQDLVSAIGVAYEERTASHVIPVRLGVYLLEHFKEEHPEMGYHAKEIGLLQNKVMILRPSSINKMSWSALKPLRLDDYLGATVDIGELEGYSRDFVTVATTLYDFLTKAVKEVLSSSLVAGNFLLRRYTRGYELSVLDNDKLAEALDDKGFNLNGVKFVDDNVMRDYRIKSKEGKLYIDFRFLHLNGEFISNDLSELVSEVKGFDFDTDFSDYTPSARLLMLLHAYYGGTGDAAHVPTGLLGLKCALNRICMLMESRI